MRDPNRIHRIAIKLAQAWVNVPDWRLGQLVSNLIGPGPQDIFHVEDDQWEELIDTFISYYNARNSHVS